MYSVCILIIHIMSMHSMYITDEWRDKHVVNDNMGEIFDCNSK